jgi:hypothetical protein
MRSAELEARVHSAIDARRKGRVPSEDDFVECKREWPDPSKPRQLAGLANRAGGEPVLLIVGFDDQTGAVGSPSHVDPAKWWDQLSKEFNQEPPELLRHMRVHVGDEEHVHAYAFATDRAPYVVKNGQYLDVPMRHSTGTRSAYRSELVRMLLPTLRAPRAEMLSASLAPTLQQIEQRHDEASQEWRGTATIFFEKVTSEPIMLPTYRMTGELTVGQTPRPVNVFATTGEIWLSSANKAPRAPSPYGAEIRSDGVVLTGSAEVRLSLRASLFFQDLELTTNAKNMKLNLHLGVAGMERPISVANHLSRTVRHQQGFSGDGQQILSYEFDAQ